ncbi:hypothetical protein, partial [Dialister succinatiphilus]|uniref:hypothetical protein n=1 Tax=Dialister succinatiphilus TaxID=487173 RepID=UPI003F804B73
LNLPGDSPDRLFCFLRGMKKAQICLLCLFLMLFLNKEGILHWNHFLYNPFDGKERSGDNIRSGFDFI